MTQMIDFRKVFNMNNRCTAMKIYTLPGMETETKNVQNVDKNILIYFYQNDKLVNIKCTLKPGATHNATLLYYHDKIITGMTYGTLF